MVDRLARLRATMQAAWEQEQALADQLVMILRGHDALEGVAHTSSGVYTVLRDIDIHRTAEQCGDGPPVETVYVQAVELPGN